MWLGIWRGKEGAGETDRKRKGGLYPCKGREEKVGLSLLRNGKRGGWPSPFRRKREKGGKKKNLLYLAAFAGRIWGRNWSFDLKKKEKKKSSHVFATGRRVINESFFVEGEQAQKEPGVERKKGKGQVIAREEKGRGNRLYCSEREGWEKRGEIIPCTSYKKEKGEKNEHIIAVGKGEDMTGGGISGGRKKRGKVVSAFLFLLRYERKGK